MSKISFTFPRGQQVKRVFLNSSPPNAAYMRPGYAATPAPNPAVSSISCLLFLVKFDQIQAFFF